MRLLGLGVCLAAAYRLRTTPLFGVALANAGVNAAALIADVATMSRDGAPRRLFTALSHVAAALGAFFLFTSFALP